MVSGNVRSFQPSCFQEIYHKTNTASQQVLTRFWENNEKTFLIIILIIIFFKYFTKSYRLEFLFFKSTKQFLFSQRWKHFEQN